MQGAASLGLVVLVVSGGACLGPPVYRGCPCQDPLCHSVQDDSAAERQPCACGWCVSCHRVSACERVCELVLCDGVPHCKTVIVQTNCGSCVLWNGRILTRLLDDERSTASSLSFPALSSMSLLT